MDGKSLIFLFSEILEISRHMMSIVLSHREILFFEEMFVHFGREIHKRLDLFTCDTNHEIILEFEDSFFRHMTNMLVVANIFPESPCN